MDNKEWKNVHVEDITNKLNTFWNSIWKIWNHWILKYLIFISTWILLVKNIYESMWLLIVYNMSTVYSVFWYWLLVWIGLSLTWNSIMNILNWLITKYSSR